MPTQSHSLNLILKFKIFKLKENWSQYKWDFLDLESTLL